MMRIFMREARVRKVFVDTWAWYALADKADAEHVHAQTANEALLDDGVTFATTNFVLAEAVTLIRYHLHHAAAVQFWRMIQQMSGGGLLEVVRVSEQHEATAWDIFEKYHDQKFSYVDCTSFAIMRELKIERAFTADHHFLVMGFTLIS